MRTRYGVNLLAFVVLFLLIQGLFACGPGTQTDSQSLPTIMAIPPTQPAGTIQSSSETGSAAASYVTAQTIEQLATFSELIVVGDAIGAGDTINMARNVNDITQPDPNLLIVGQIYHIAIRRSLKGSSAYTIDVVQPEAYLFAKTPKTQANIDAARAKDDHIAIQLGVHYLFFLEPLQGFAGHDYFTGVREPWRFLLPDSGNAIPESPWAGAKQVFRAKPSSDLISEVEFWVSGGKFPTPTEAPTPLRPLSTPARSPYP